MLDAIILGVVAAILFTFVLFGAAVTGALLVILFVVVILLGVLGAIIEGLE